MPRKPKALTREQLHSRKDKAVRFTRDVVGDADRADEIASESLDDYAAHRRIQLTNPRRRPLMARKTIEDYRDENKDLKQQIRDLEDEKETLNDKLDAVADALDTDQDEDEDDDAGADDDDDSDSDPD